MDKQEYHRYWQEVLSRYEKSDLSQKQFCQVNQIKFHRFKNYRYRYKQGCQSKVLNSLSSQKLIPIKAQAEPLPDTSVSTPMIILLKNGLQIKVTMPFDKASLKQLIEIAQAC